ncbi:VOC family protein [Anaeromyxobacter diazotrophicus]|uniref:Glyoxalase n=1 Tax=Anaeromyxobacter diazotrophicus TaxID=2590199 RepID=A0A7I9VHC4_9BACT|nr:VOC family protein [Anaeromyxobacter diazotrophicus]GEJ55548.1 glyoxalase [Anaeromyxobacter diazotrophicus]
MIELDHLVVAALTLDEGMRWVRERVGVAPEPGGQHLGFGTHNALLRLGEDVYLEVLAPDPAQPEPPRSRLFGLDGDATRASLERGPRLLHWVVRTGALGAAIRRLATAAGLEPAAVGLPTPMQRGQLRWTLALPSDGSRPPGGLPSVIDWGATPHPCSRLPDRGVRLERLELAAEAPIASALAELTRDPRVALAAGAPARCIAHLAAPSGTATLGEGHIAGRDAT